MSAMFKTPNMPDRAAHRALTLRVLWGTIASQVLVYPLLALWMGRVTFPVALPRVEPLAPLVALAAAAVALSLVWVLGPRYEPDVDPASGVLPADTWKTVVNGVVTTGMIG